MKIKVVNDYKTMSKKGAKIVEKAVREKPKIVLGLPTGNTFTGFYKELVSIHKEKGLDFSNVKTFNLDEYVGLSPTHPQSFRHYMKKHLFKHVNIKEKNHHIPNGNANDLEKVCKEYERKIKNHGGIDLQFLGIGENGHIGYNEPGSSFNSRTRVVNLSEETRKSKTDSFGRTNKVPKKAITMGIGTILESDKIILLASGKEKAEAVYKSIEENPSKKVPASALQKHQDTQLILDKGSASKISSRS